MVNKGWGGEGELIQGRKVGLYVTYPISDCKAMKLYKKSRLTGFEGS
jgi:hypothetical protein